MTNFFILDNIFYCFLIVATPIFMQRTADQSIDETKFKKYKIKRLGFLFKGMQGESASNYGVILPMLIIQIQGYVVGIITLTLMIINEFINFVEEPFGILITILFTHVLISIIITIITGLVSRKRKK